MKLSKIPVTIAIIALFVAPAAETSFSQTAEWDWDTPLDHTNCDGFTVTNVDHSGNRIADFMSAPFIKVWYPDNLILVDQPGLTGCPITTQIASYTYHFPTHVHQGGPPAFTWLHAIWFVGGCDDFILVDGCYKYEQINWFQDYGGPTSSPRFKHIYKIYGIGFYFDHGYPLYHVFFKVNVDVLGPSGDTFKRWDGSMWDNIDTEQSFFSNGATGAQFRVFDSSSTSKYLQIQPTLADNFPKVWVLQDVGGENDPTFNSQSSSNNEPSIWDGTGSTLNQDIVYWYKTYVGMSASTCQPTAPCSVGPTVLVRGGL